MDFSSSWQASKLPISWHKTPKTQHFINYWCFGLWKPVFLHFIRQNYLNQIKKSQGTSLDEMGKHFSKKSETQEFRNFGNLRCPLFEFLKFGNPDFLIITLCQYYEMMKSRRRGISWHSFCRRNFLKSLDMNFISIKNMNWFSPNTNQLFYFRAR